MAVANPEPIRVYIPDRSYDYSEDEVAASEALKKSLEGKYNVALSSANIGAGADWPAFVCE